MEKLFDIICCTGFVGLELLIIFGSALLIQLVVYQLTGFSIYNNLFRLIDKLEERCDKYDY